MTVNVYHFLNRIVLIIKSEMLNKNICTSYYCLLFILVNSLFPSWAILEKLNNTRNKTLILNEIFLSSPLNFNNKTNGNNESYSTIHQIKNREYTLAEVLRHTYNEFEELFENIVGIIATNVPKITKDTEIFLGKISNHTMDALNTLRNKILYEDDVLLSETFLNMERQLELVKKEFENLAISVDENFNWAVTQLNQTLINNTEEYDWWTAYMKQRLRTVIDTKIYQEGCKALDEFIYYSSKELEHCCKITMTPIRSLCKSATSLITEALHIIVDVIDRMQACLEEKNSYLNYLLPCIHLAYDEMSSLVSRAAQMTHLVNNMLPMKIIYTRSCFAIVRVDMKVRRESIESRIFSNKYN